ncbi:hypothetical protein SCc_559 [Serratia symbiotica str. 'Cinara cedri']|nr:hypothetical protein SCc_559 [Serratia symbiotica str. 'Cinara cedri']
MVIYTAKNKYFNSVFQYLAKNTKILIVLVVIGIAAIFSLYFWQKDQGINLVEVLQSYQEASDLLVTGTSEDVATVERFVENNINSYGVLVALQLAKHFVKQNNFSKAEQQLIEAQLYTKDVNLLAQINLRLARIQLQEKKCSAALKTLDKVKDESWTSLVEDTRGDILLVKGDTEGAREAYSKGLKSTVSLALKALLQIKLNNLSNEGHLHAIA